MTKLEIALPDNIQEIKSYEIVNGFLVVMYEEKPKRPTTIKEVMSITLHDDVLEALIILMQLLKIRDIWNGDWRPDWFDADKKKHILVLQKDKWQIQVTFVISGLFYFRDYQTAQDFLSTFQTELDKIKILFQ